MAVDPLGIIGYQGKLPWKYPEETAHFRSLVANNAAIIGGDSFQAATPSTLATCHTLVLSKNPVRHHEKGKLYSTIDYLQDPNEVFTHPYCQSETRINFVLGGSHIMNWFLAENQLDGFILTLIKKTYPGDRSINLDSMKDWIKTPLSQNENYDIFRCLNPSSPLFKRLHNDGYHPL